jgi:hypothetical protein
MPKGCSIYKQMRKILFDCQLDYAHLNHFRLATNHPAAISGSLCNFDTFDVAFCPMFISDAVDSHSFCEISKEFGELTPPAFR